MSRGAVAHAAGFGWDATAAALHGVYRDVLAERVVPATLAANR
jgi:hypothetical protein